MHLPAYPTFTINQKLVDRYKYELGYIDNGICPICGSHGVKTTQLPGETSPRACEECYRLLKIVSDNQLKYPLKYTLPFNASSMALSTAKEIVEYIRNYEREISEKKVKYDAAVNTYLISEEDTDSAGDDTFSTKSNKVEKENNVATDENGIFSLFKKAIRGEKTEEKLPAPPRKSNHKSLEEELKASIKQACREADEVSRKKIVVEKEEVSLNDSLNKNNPLLEGYIKKKATGNNKESEKQDKRNPFFANDDEW